jgi:predicted DNA-binding transcriptional regulator AlpA
MYLGFRDLMQRWVYTRQGLYKMMQQTDFPAPVFTINAGHTKVWRLGDIAAYETQHPEVTSEDAKRRKVAGYARALARKHQAA